MHCLEQVTALAAAATAGLPDEAARFWAQQEAVRDIGTVPTIVEILERPDVSVPTIRATPLAVDRVSGIDGWARYTAAIGDIAGDRRIMVRLPLPEARAVISLGARALLLRVEISPHALTTRSEVVADGGGLAMTVTPADDEPAGWAFVGALLVESLRQGMPDAEIDAASQCEWLDAFLRVGHPDGTAGWVARVDGEVCGTVAARPHLDPVLRRAEVELIDCYPVGPHRRAAQGALIAVVARWATAKRPSAPLVSKVVGEGGKEFQILERLEAAGWRGTWALVSPA